MGLPADCPPIPDVGGVVELETFLHACEVSFMEARNLRRKSLAMESLSNAAAAVERVRGVEARVPHRADD